jgi:SAM-dependent methyltransferase
MRGDEQRPFSQACENNKLPILAVLERYLGSASRVLEIGSGTGQHAVFFAGALPHLVWQTSDLPENHAGILAWLAHADLPNLRAPLELDVTRQPWPLAADVAERPVGLDAVFSANTAHIMSWPAVEALVRGVSRVLAPGGLFLLYGPFHRDGRPTSESNARFDAWLAERDPRMRVRNFEDVDREARRVGLALIEDCAMPANNRLLVWRMRGSP